MQSLDLTHLCTAHLAMSSHSGCCLAQHFTTQALNGPERGEAPCIVTHLPHQCPTQVSNVVQLHVALLLEIVLPAWRSCGARFFSNNCWSSVSGSG